MNFFEAQDRARRNSALLFVLFAAAVASLVVLVYLAAALFLDPESARAGTVVFNPDLFFKTTGGVLAVVAFGSLTKTLALKAGGGAAVAQAMGGRLIPPSTRDPLERRLINVVDEMAIASGVPAPQVYLTPDAAVNAFAAGSRPDNAVVGMTRGALESLSRDELQGVVAHEFSHILNGDMRLNMRLIGILHGVLLLGYIGYFILRSTLYGGMMRSRDRGGAAAALPLIGLALVVVGFAGSFFGNWIRAAVSRQREFLADASAVQFTRNPRGIGGALEKIGVLSGMLQSPRASECRHMCFSDSVASGFANPFATHPPLDERIRRVFPQWDGKQTIGEYDGAIKKRIAKMQNASGSGFVSGDGASGFSGGESERTVQVSDVDGDDSVVDGDGSVSEESPPDLFAMLFGDDGERGNESGDDGGGSDAKGVAGDAPLPPLQVTERVGQLTPDARRFASRLRRAIPKSLREAAHDPHSARSLLYAMLLDSRDAECRGRQLKILAERGDAGVCEEASRLYPMLLKLPRFAWMPLAETAAPALRMLSPRQRKLFAENSDALVAADGAMELFEWCLQASALRHLFAADGAGKEWKTRSTTLHKSRNECAHALSVLALAGSGGDEAAARLSFSAALEWMPESLRPVSGTDGSPESDGSPGSGVLEFDGTGFIPAKLLLATRALSGLGSGEKRMFIAACAACAAKDGVVSIAERDLLSVFASLLDCPLPPV